jgi:hypothetical protein
MLTRVAHRRKPENTQNQASRLANGRFAPGASPNPGGRPREIGDVRELARSHTAESVETLATIMRSGKSEVARITAATSLLDRGWGRPAQVLDVSHREAADVAELSYEELTEIVRRGGDAPSPGRKVH